MAAVNANFFSCIDISKDDLGTKRPMLGTKCVKHVSLSHGCPAITTVKPVEGGRCQIDVSMTVSGWICLELQGFVHCTTLVLAKVNLPQPTIHPLNRDFMTAQSLDKSKIKFLLLGAFTPLRWACCVPLVHADRSHLRRAARRGTQAQKIADMHFVGIRLAPN